MKRTKLLHAALSEAVAAAGHGDTIVIADVGLPVPNGVPVIDLAVLPGVPKIWDVLDAVLSEFEVEEAFIAEEAEDWVKDAFKRFTGVEEIPHEELKARSASARAIVRTGEVTPYANIILVAGVTF